MSPGSLVLTGENIVKYGYACFAISLIHSNFKVAEHSFSGGQR